jgi:hypothetical protein
MMWHPEHDLSPGERTHDMHMSEFVQEDDVGLEERKLEENEEQRRRERLKIMITPHGERERERESERERN